MADLAEETIYVPSSLVQTLTPLCLQKQMAPDCKGTLRFDLNSRVGLMSEELCESVIDNVLERNRRDQAVKTEQAERRCPAMNAKCI